MEIGRALIRTVQVSCKVSNLPQIRGFTNIISIYQYEEIEELIEYESSGMVTNLGSHGSHPLETNYHIFLKPRNLTPYVLSQLIYDGFLFLRITQSISESLVNDTSLRQPLLVLVNVNFIKERRSFMPSIVFPPSSLSTGAPGEVFNRLFEEQRVELADLENEDETCSICIKNFSESHEKIIRMPDCLHMFHQDCLFGWLRRQNSCPLCLKVPYDEEEEEG